jgi:hypothetical protein
MYKKIKKYKIKNKDKNKSLKQSNMTTAFIPVNEGVRGH